MARSACRWNEKSEMGTLEVRTTLRLERPVHLGHTLGPLQRGVSDPSTRIRGSECIRASHSSDGCSALWLRLQGDEAEARAWGPGAERQISLLSDLLGQSDDSTAFTIMLETMTLSPYTRGLRLLKDLHRSMPGLRIPQTQAVFEALLPVIIEQRVTGHEAWRSYRHVVFKYGEPAPGPADIFGSLRCPPSPDALTHVPYWELHRMGIEMKRATTLLRAAGMARRLEAVIDLPQADAREMLTSIPGIGAWTAAEVALVALGDADAVSVGDFHIPNQVAFAFTGAPRGDDATMLELLEPFRGQRGRVIRLIQAGGVMAPRRGPRMALNPIRDR